MMRIPPRASVSRPVTSAWILPRSRNLGRRRLKALVETTAKSAMGTSASAVITASMRRRKKSAMSAVTMPPTSWTSPVPTRFRTPSTSFMIRDTSSPDFVSSKVRTGRRRTWRWTWARSSAIRCWASTLRIRVRVKEVIACTVVAATSSPSSG